MHRLVGVDDPGHLPLARAIVWSGHIHPRTDEVLLDQFIGVAARHPLQLLDCILRGVDLDRAFRSAKGDIDDGAFVGHEGSERFDLVLVHLGSVADPTLGRQLVMAMLDPPGLDHLEGGLSLRIDPSQRELEMVDTVAELDLLDQAGGVVGEDRGSFHGLQHILEETCLG